MEFMNNKRNDIRFFFKQQIVEASIPHRPMVYVYRGDEFLFRRPAVCVLSPCNQYKYFLKFTILSQEEFARKDPGCWRTDRYTIHTHKCVAAEEHLYEHVFAAATHTDALDAGDAGSIITTTAEIH